MKKFIAFLKDVRVEMKKVSWPSKDELISSTGIVVVVWMVLVLFTAFFDKIFNTVVQFFLLGNL